MGAAAGGAATLTVERSNGTQPAGKKSPVAWIPGENIDVVAWVRVGQRLGTMTRCSQWWLGDWIRYGTTRWGEKYKEAARITGYDVKTLRNIAYVAEHVDVSRRRDNLSWSHHAEVCALEPEQQDKWLDRAASERMSVADLRIELRTAQRVEDGPTPRSNATAGTVICPECQHQFDPSSLAGADRPGRS
jgi:hypothetical protein